MSEEQIPQWAQALIREVTILNERLPNHVDWTERNIKDHEVRIRDLEKARWQTAWITAAASAAMTAVIVALVNLLVSK
jgi:type IV secretory pathway component VirB8